MTALPARTGVSDTYPKPTNKQAKEALGQMWDVLSEIAEKPEVDLASAATCDIGGQSSTRIRITGTTTITSFGVNYRGPILLRIAASLTITHDSATLICPGAADLITEAGDMLLVSPKATSGVSDGWQIVQSNSGSALPFLSIKSIGAVGDGTTDDTAAFQSALNSSFQDIYIPAGDYILSDQLVHSGKAITITGAGINKTRLLWSSGATNTGISFTQADDDFHITISGLSFVTGKAGTGTAIAVDGSGQITGGNIQNRSKPRLFVNDVEFRGLIGVNTDGWGYGIDAVSVMAAQVARLYFAGKYTTDGVNIVSNSMCRFSGSGNPVHISISKCDAYYAQECIKFESVEGAYVSGCNLVSVGKGVVFDGVSGEPMLQCTTNHINAYVTAVEMSQCHQANVSLNNIYSRSGALDVVKGVHLKSGTLYCAVLGNVIVSAAGTDTIDGVVMESGALGNLVDDNVFQGGRRGISSFGASTDNNIGPANYFNGVTLNYFGGATVRYTAGSAGVHSFDTVVRPATSDATDLGGSINQWKDLYLSSSVKVGGNKIIGARETGWGATMTGTADKTTVRDVATVTTPQLAARVKALEDALRTHGLIGS